MKRGTGKAQCICPAHVDTEASLTLTDGNDRALIRCHAGCSVEKVVDAAGLKMSDLFYGDGLAKERWRAYIENREKRKIEAVYNYASINGDYAYTKVRLEGKKMLFGILSNERFAYGLNGKNKKMFNAVYGSISSIKRAIERKEPVFIPEGEKDVNTLVKKGYAAFSCGGANDWNKNVSELCKDADVIVLSDNDDPGKKLASTVVEDLTIGGLFDGLEEGGTAGKIAAFLGKAFLAVKIADITGIGSLVKLLIGAIGKKIIGSEAVAALSGSLTSVLGKAASAAAGGFTSLASSLAPLVGTAGLIAAVATAAIVGTEKLAGFIETLQGGNGVLTQAGGYLHDYAGAMSSSNVITQKQAEDLWKLIEADESAGKSNAEMYDSFIHKLAEYGISAEQAKAILEQYGAQAGVTGTFVEDMTNKVLALGQGFSESAGQIDLSSLSAKEAISVLSDTLYTLSLKGNEFSGTYQGVRSQLQDTGGSAKSAQDALNMVYTALKNAGVPLDDLNAALGAEFPAATTAVTTAVDTNIVGAQEKISSSIKTAQTDVEEATAGIKSSTEENFAGVNDSTVLNWGNSAKEVKTNVRAMKIQANLSLGEMTKGVKSQFQSQYNIMTRKWKNASDEINRTVGGMSGSIDKSLSSLVGKVESYGSRMESGLSGAISRAADRISTTLNNIISKVNGMINNINSAISGIERGFTFSYNVQLPNGGRRWGNYFMSLPRVNSVPYLASGAVIPPRSEFLAVLGDQKKGNNLETPESLLRQIVREESGKGQGDGNTYNVTVNASGRKLLDIIINEAEMRRNRNGKNPFELA